jgi:hypothetical protein
MMSSIQSVAGQPVARLNQSNAPGFATIGYDLVGQGNEFFHGFELQ